MDKIKHILLSGILAITVASCQTINAADSLYQSLGQEAGIKHIVEDFINELLTDSRISHHFEEADLDRFHDKLVEQLCELSGGPCKYSGKNMKKLHSDFEINEAQFNALVEALMLVMDNNKISVGAQNRLLALLVPMQADIVSD
jgi:hemoglobin